MSNEGNCSIWKLWGAWVVGEVGYGKDSTENCVNSIITILEVLWSFSLEVKS